MGNQSRILKIGDGMMKSIKIDERTEVQFRGIAIDTVIEVEGADIRERFHYWPDEDDTSPHFTIIEDITVNPEKQTIIVNPEKQAHEKIIVI